MTYDSYGNPCPTCTINTPYGYAGAYTDPTGLDYLTNRYYDPSAASFMSVDPLVSLTQEPYGYVNDDPVNGTDPLGLCHGLFGCIGQGWHDTLGQHWQGTLQVVGVVAGAAAFATGIGEIAAGAYAVTEGAELLDVAAGTYGTASSIAGAVATVSDIPGCASDPGIATCAGLALGAAGFGTGLSAGEVTWEDGLTAEQGLTRALVAAGSIGTAAWDGFSALSSLDLNTRSGRSASC
jgi:RHS repeat-associated protein